MLGKRFSCVEVDLEEVVKTLSEQGAELDYYEVYDLFWDSQEYGTDCYVKLYLDCTHDREAVEAIKNGTRSWLSQDDLPYYEARLKIREYIRNNVPEDIEWVLVEINY